MSSQNNLRRTSWGAITGIAAGAALGSALMFLYDPLQGRRRRAYARDKVRHWQRASGFTLTRQVRNVRNHVYGWVAETMSLLRPGPPPSDQKLESRVRSMVGRNLTHPAAIDVKVAAATVVLQGEIPSWEIEGVVRRARKIRGVKHVINRLTPRSSTEHISSLQGEGKRTRASWQGSESFQELLT